MILMLRFVLAFRRRFAAVTILVSLTCSSALAGGLCTSANQILIAGPNGQGACIKSITPPGTASCGPSQGLIPLLAANGTASCVAAPCPSGYVKDLPPQQLIGPAPVLSEWLVIGNSCTAVCTPLFVDNNWPCGCPYGQKLDPATRNCAPVCAGSAVWQHSPGFTPDPNGYGKQDAGVCGCPSGQQYAASIKDCVPIGGSSCTPGSGMIFNGAGCVCPAGGYLQNGKCVLCPVGLSGTGLSQLPPACQPTVTCAPGKKWDMASKTCVAADEATGITQPGNLNHTCPAGSKWNGASCVVSQPPALCGPGTHASGNACVPNTLLLIGCPRGTHLQNGACVNDVPTCAVRTHWNGRACVAN